MATSKKRGIKSSAQDNFLQPDPVTGLSGTNVGTGRAWNNGAVNLSWSLPATSPAATSYIITSNPATTTLNTGSSATSATFTGLSGGTSYTFTVRGTNAAGTANSNPATDTTGSIAVTTVPNAAGSPSASATSANNNTISWTLPATGGSALTSIRITGSDGSSYTGISPSATSYVANDPGSSPGSQSYTIFVSNANGESAGATTSTINTTPPFFPFFPPFFPFFPPFFPFFPSFSGCKCTAAYCYLCSCGTTLCCC